MTLVEMMIAVMLLGMVLTMVYASFFQISRHSSQLEAQLKERQVLRMLMRVISDDLASARWLGSYWSKGVGHDTGLVSEMKYIGGGEFTAINLHTAQPTRFYRRINRQRDPMLHEVGYYVEQDTEKDELVLYRREDFYLDEDMRDGGLKARLAGRLTEFKVEFLAPGTPDSTELGREAWETAWNAPDAPDNARMPMAVRVTLARRSETGEEVREQAEFNLAAAFEIGKQ